MSEAELRVWAEAHAGVGIPLAAAVLRLLDEREAKTRLILSLAERVTGQSESLGRLAQRSALAEREGGVEEKLDQRQVVHG